MAPRVTKEVGVVPDHIRRVAQVLLAQHAFDNEPDAIRAAIMLLAAADSASRAECLARHPSAQNDAS